MDDASDAINKAGPTLYSGSPTRQGASRVTPSPRTAHSRASFFVKAFTPPLLAQYAFAPRPTPTAPAIDEKLRMTPAPFFNMILAAAWQHKNVPRGLISRTGPHVQGGWDSPA